MSRTDSHPETASHDAALATHLSALQRRIAPPLPPKCPPPVKSPSHKRGNGKFNGVTGYNGGRPSQAAVKEQRLKVRKAEESQPTLTFQVIFFFLFIYF
jgi:hypothetical protein